MSRWKFVVIAAFSSNAKLVAIAGKDKKALLSDTATKNRRASIDTDAPAVRGLAFTPGKQRLLTTTVSALIVSPDGNSAFSASADGVMRQCPLPLEKK